MLQRVTEYVPMTATIEHSGGADTDRWQGITLSEIVRILRRRFTIIAACVAALVIVAAAVIVFVRPLYTATSTILIDPRRPNTVNVDSSQTTVQSPQTDDATIESQVSLVQSIAVLRRVVSRWVKQHERLTERVVVLDEEDAHLLHSAASRSG